MFGAMKSALLASANRTRQSAQPQVDPYTKLLLHCDGTNGSTTFVDSACGKTVTACGSAQISTATFKFGSSSLFVGGNGNHLSIPESDDFKFGAGDFTIDFWARYSGNTSHWFFQSGQDAYLMIRYNSGDYTWRIGYYNGTSYLFDEYTTYSIQLDTWYHIALTRSQNQFTLYVNGQAIKNFTSTVSVNSSGIFMCGSSLIGNIDEFRVSKGIARWTGNFVPMYKAYTNILGEPNEAVTKTVLLLHCDGVNGSTTFIDSATGKQVNVFGNTHISKSQYVFGSSSAYFDLVGDYLKLSDHDDFKFETGAFTIDFRFRFETTTGCQFLCSKGGDQVYSSVHGWSIVKEFESANRFMFRMFDSRLKILLTLSTAMTIDQSRWYHCAVVRNTLGETILYIDGYSRSAGYYSGNEMDNSGNLHIGTAYDETGCFNGYIDEFRITKGGARWSGDFTPPISPYL